MESEPISRIEELQEGNVLSGVRPHHIESYGIEIVHAFYLKAWKYVKGLLFPHCDIITSGEEYDAIVSRIRQKEQSHLLLCEVYHSDEELLSMPINIRISEMTRRGRPGFRLRGYPGHYIGRLETGQAKVGDHVLARVNEISPGERKDKFLKADLIAIIQAA